MRYHSNGCVHKLIEQNSFFFYLLIVATHTLHIILIHINY